MVINFQKRFFTLYKFDIRIRYKIAPLVLQYTAEIVNTDSSIA